MQVRSNFSRINILMQSHLIKLFILGIFLTISPISHGGYVSATRNATAVFKAGKYQKIARLGTLEVKDLTHASKAENIQGLLDIALQENRVDAVQMLQYERLYSFQKHGDQLLLVCLKATRCQPDKFVEIVKTSKLHSEIAFRQPELGSVLVNHAVGEITENLMIRYFESSGWKKIPSQIGRQGIDGLFIKMEGEIIKEVLIVESKYNTSILQLTNHGTQMSDQWVRRKVYELNSKYPDDTTYKTIDKFVNAGSYRAILWNIKADETSLKVSLRKVKSKGGNVTDYNVVGTENEVLAAPFENDIKIEFPKNKFEDNFVGWYKNEIARFNQVKSSTTLVK